jgi:hypothetical protein
MPISNRITFNGQRKTVSIVVNPRNGEIKQFNLDPIIDDCVGVSVYIDEDAFEPPIQLGYLPLPVTECHLRAMYHNHLKAYHKGKEDGVKEIRSGILTLLGVGLTTAHEALQTHESLLTRE